MAAAIARPTPVLPDVGSTIVPPGRRCPSRSAASIIARPIRSFTEPPGFRYSSFARIVPGTSREIRSRRTIGVPPTSSSTPGYTRGISQRLTASADRLTGRSGGESVAGKRQGGGDGRHARGRDVDRGALEAQRDDGA